MGRFCYICKIDPKEPGNEIISLHSLPINIDRRNIWFSLLGLDKDSVYPKSVFICSKHFKPSDIIINNIGKKLLKRDAVPIPCHDVFEHQESKSSPSHSESTISIVSVSSEDSPLKKRPRTESCTEFNIPSTSFVSVASSSTSIASEMANSSTITPSESEEILTQTEKISTKESIKNQATPRRRKRKNYLGDMEEEDFGSPKSKRNFLILRRMILTLRKKVQTLQCQLWKAKRKINNLNDLLKYSKENSFITESCESEMSDVND